MKERLKKAKQNISKALTDVMTRFEARSTFITFAVIYFPVAWLFLGRGALEQTLLVLYTVLMVLGGFVLLRKFVDRLVKAANDHDGNYGTLFKEYLVYALLPLGMFKYFALVVSKMLPFSHEGLPELLCDFYNMLGWFYPNYLRGYERPAEFFDIQQALGWLIIGSFTAVFIFTLWSVQKARTESKK